MQKLKKILKPFANRLRRESLLQSVFAAMSAGIVAAFVTMLMMRLFARTYVFGVMIGIAVVVAVAVGIVTYTLIYKLSYRQMLRRIDEADLHERVTTMCDLWGDDSFIANKQRQDTLSALKALRPHAIHFHIPLITSIITFAVTACSAAAALIPQRIARVSVDTPIYDEYLIVSPVINQLVYDAYHKIDATYPDISTATRDELEEIIKEIDSSLNDGITEKTDSERASELENALEKAEDLLEEVQMPKFLLSTALRQLAGTKELGEAIASKSNYAEKTKLALENMNPGTIAQVRALLQLVKDSSATNATVLRANTRLQSLISLMQAGNTETGNAFTDAECRELARNTLQMFRDDLTVLDTDLRSILASKASLAELGQALVNADAFAVTDTLTTIRDTLTEMSFADMSEAVQTMAADIADAVAAANLGDDDATQSALMNFRAGLIDIQNLADANMNATQRIADVFSRSVNELSGVAASYATDNRLTNTLIEKLDGIVNGTILSASLGSIANDIDMALGTCNYNAMTDIALVQALVSMSQGLHSAANVNGIDADNRLLANVLNKAYEEIVAALTQIEKDSEAIEDIMDDLKEAIDEIMQETTEKNEVQIDTGEQEKQPESDEENQDSAQEEQQDPSQSPSTSPGGTQDNTDGLFYYNPITGQEEILTTDALEAFKAQLDQAKENSTYTDEQLEAINRYYENIAQRLNQKT